MEEFEELYRKLNQRSVFVPVNEVLDFENVEQVKQFVKDHYYSDTKLMFEYDNLNFPNTYVFVELSHEVIDNNGEDDIWLREQTKLAICTLDEFKKSIIKTVSEFN